MSHYERTWPWPVARSNRTIEVDWSANPQPVCRRGGCGTVAVEGGEWCEFHGAQVAARRAQAAGQRRGAVKGPQAPKKAAS